MAETCIEAAAFTATISIAVTDPESTLATTISIMEDRITGVATITDTAVGLTTVAAATIEEDTVAGFPFDSKPNLGDH